INEVAIASSAIFEPKKRLTCLCSKMCLKKRETLFPVFVLAIFLIEGIILSSPREVPRRLTKLISTRYLKGKSVDIRFDMIASLDEAVFASIEAKYSIKSPIFQSDLRIIGQN